MSYINWNNKDLKKCVICGKPIDTSYFVCLDCKKPCEIYLPDADKLNVGIYSTAIKSKCCNAYVSQEYVNITCSAQCHEEYIKEMEVFYGEYKIIQDSCKGNINYIVPLRTIIEKGISKDELEKFPVVFGE